VSVNGRVAVDALVVVLLDLNPQACRPELQGPKVARTVRRMALRLKGLVSSGALRVEWADSVAACSL
jgi:hypothetical protein